MLTNADVPALTNGAKLPVLSAMTCLVGRFSAPGYDSIGEVLVNHAGGGAIAVWAPTGLSLNEQATKLNRAFFEYIYANEDVILGDAVQASMRAYDSNVATFLMKIFTILGDPALRLK